MEEKNCSRNLQKIQIENTLIESQQKHISELFLKNCHFRGGPDKNSCFPPFPKKINYFVFLFLYQIN